MDKLNKLAMPDVKSGTPQEKMNAVKKALQSLEMLTEAYNQIVPVINAKIDWLEQAEKVAKDDTQDKKIDELIAVNKMLLGRVANLESKGGYDDSDIIARIKALEDKPEYKYDDKPVKKMIDEITKQQGELARTQNALDKAIKSIKIPKVPSVEPLRKRIKALEDKPQYVYDDKPLKDRVKVLEGKPQYNDGELKERVKNLESRPELPKLKEYDDSELVSKISNIEKSIESFDKRLDFIRRTYSEKWQQAEFERTKFQQSIGEQITAIETPKAIDLSDIERRIYELESVEHVEYDDAHIKKSISDIKKSIPQPVSLTGIEARIKNIEDKPSHFYNDKPITKEIENIKKELSEIKKSFNEIFE